MKLRVKNLFNQTIPEKSNSKIGRKIPLMFAPLEPDSANPILREIMGINGAEVVFRPKIIPQHLLKATNWQKLEKIKNFTKLRTKNSNQIFDGIQLLPKIGDPIKHTLSFINSRAHQLGVSFIDLNFSCPGYKVLPQGRGGELLKYPKKIIDIISNILKYSELPISLKIRKGFYNNDTPYELCKLISKEFGSNIAWITINRAPVKMEDVDMVLINNDYDIFQKTVEAVEKKIPIIANGAIYSYEHYNIIQKQTEISGIMIGRGALGNPEVFTKIYDSNSINQEKILQNQESSIFHKFNELFRVIQKYEKGPSIKWTTMGKIKRIIFNYYKSYYNSLNQQLPKGFGFNKWHKSKLSVEELVRDLNLLFPFIKKSTWNQWLKNSK